MYRAQFAYPPASDKCQAQRCSYSFDQTNTPALAGVAAGAVVTKIPLVMDQDAPFFFRGITINATGLLIRLEDCFENPLLSDQTYTAAALWSESDGAGVVALDSDEWGIYCPSGSTLLLYVQNPTAAPVLNLVVTLHGEKWYMEGACS
jgi:hypothetical protein